MSNAPSAQSGLTRLWPKYASSSGGTSAAARYFRSILKQAARRLQELDSHPDRILLSWFRSMTPEQRAGAIGRLQKLNDHVGSLYVRCLRINQSLSYSKTGFTTYRSSFEQLESRYAEQLTIPCSCTTLSNQKASKD